VTRLVLDASVLLSAVLAKPESHPSLLLEAVRSGQIEMVACGQLLREVRGGLGGRYFRDRITDADRDAIPAMLAALAVVAQDPADPPPVLRDPSDDYLVALARAASAEAIITGDRDLLDHEGLEPPALSARQACLRLGLIEQ
jgi:putative PIN family toxin of toxin-antitoxin system